MGESSRDGEDDDGGEELHLHNSSMMWSNSFALNLLSRWSSGARRTFDLHEHSVDIRTCNLGVQQHVAVEADGSQLALRREGGINLLLSTWYLSQ